MLPNMFGGDELKEQDVVTFEKPKKQARPKRHKSVRITVDEYFLKIAAVVAERSTCLRHRIGAIAVKDRRILATGYNGAPTGAKDCLELGCLRNDLNIPSGERNEICRAVHAEQNVIIQAAIHAVSLEGSTIYCTHTPCILCAKMLVNAKIKRFVTYGRYSMNAYDSFMSLRGFAGLFEEAGIILDTKDRPRSMISFHD